MQVIEFIGYRDRNCERMATRHGLTFHVDGYWITEHDDDREAREATEPELAMWSALVGHDFDPESLPATPVEVRDSLKWSRGPYTLSAVDVAALRHLKGFKPCLDRTLLLGGLIGWLTRDDVCSYSEDSPWWYPTEVEIYVSRAIPCGYYYAGARDPELHWRPDPGGPRVLEPELDHMIECRVRVGLRPFIREWP